MMKEPLYLWCTISLHIDRLSTSGQRSNHHLHLPRLRCIRCSYASYSLWNDYSMRLLPCTCSSSYRKGLHCCNCNMCHCMPCLCCATLAHYITLCLRSNWSCSHSSEQVQLHDDISRVQLQWWCHLTAVEDASTSVIRCRTAFQSA